MPEHVFDRISRGLPDIRSSKQTFRREGTAAWFPYYAGYTTEFVEDLLDFVSVNSDTVVLDPWNGSGTTTTIASKHGCLAIGFDINPVSTLVSNARLVRAADAMHSQGLAMEILKIARKVKCSEFEKDPLDVWLSKKLRKRFRAIETTIVSLMATREGFEVRPITGECPPFASFLLLCLIRTARSFIHTINSNPTWMIPAEKVGDGKIEDFDSMFLGLVSQSALDLNSEFQTHLKIPPRSYSIIADCRNMPLKDSSIDLIIGSPPYCTRIDYFKATAFELAALGISENSEIFEDLRRKAIGTNLIRANDSESDLPVSVNRVLRKISQHPSRASKSYYLKGYRQYFEDINKSIKEMGRVLKPDGLGILVVQSSYYKEIEIPLGTLFKSIAKEAGLRSNVVAQFPVKRYLTAINAKSMQYAGARNYSEDVVAFSKE